MLRALRPYFVTVLIVWIALAAAAQFFRTKFPAQSHWIIAGVLPAFALEALFFVAAGFEPARKVLQRARSRAFQSLLLWTSALVPFLLVTQTAGTFDSHAFIFLMVLCGILSFWWTVLPHRAAYDLGFLVLAAAPIVLRIFSRLYVTPEPKIEISILGHLMWIRLALMVLLIERGFDVGPIGFWPRRQEWREGLLQFGLSIVPTVIIALAVQFAGWAPKNQPPLREAGLAIGTFFGILWVVAFSEDIFRSVLTRLFLSAHESKALAVAGSGLLFGSAHLWYHDFPNWRFAVTAAVAHMFYTVAYLRAGSVRASMVTHALTVTTWRMLFRTLA